MEVIFIKKPEHFGFIAGKFNEMNPNYSFTQLTIRMERGVRIGLHNFAAFGAVDAAHPDELLGFVLMERVVPVARVEAFVWLAWISPAVPELHKDLMNEMEAQCQRWGACKVSIGVKDREKAWERKFGFEPESIIMAKEIKLPEPKKILVPERKIAIK